jgi:hypothetical protein
MGRGDMGGDGRHAGGWGGWGGWGGCVGRPEGASGGGCAGLIGRACMHARRATGKAGTGRHGCGPPTALGLAWGLCKARPGQAGKPCKHRPRPTPSCVPLRLPPPPPPHPTRARAQAAAHLPVPPPRHGAARAAPHGSQPECVERGVGLDAVVVLVLVRLLRLCTCTGGEGRAMSKLAGQVSSEGPGSMRRRSGVLVLMRLLHLCAWWARTLSSGAR